MNFLLRVLQLYVAPLAGAALIASGVYRAKFALAVSGALLVGFYLGVRATAWYLWQVGVIDPPAAKRHHDWLNHGGPPPGRP